MLCVWQGEDVNMRFLTGFAVVVQTHLNFFEALEPLWLSQHLFKRTHIWQFSGIQCISNIVLPQIQRTMPMLLSSTRDLFLSGTTEFYWLVTCYLLRYSYAVKSIKRKIWIKQHLKIYNLLGVLLMSNAVFWNISCLKGTIWWSLFYSRPCKQKYCIIQLV